MNFVLISFMFFLKLLSQLDKFLVPAWSQLYFSKSLCSRLAIVNCLSMRSRFCISISLSNLFSTHVLKWLGGFIFLGLGHLYNGSYHNRFLMTNIFAHLSRLTQWSARQLFRSWHTVLDACIHLSYNFTLFSKTVGRIASSESFQEIQ